MMLPTKVVYGFTTLGKEQEVKLSSEVHVLCGPWGPPKEKGVHFKIFQSTYIVLSFCCIAAAEKKIFSSGGQKNHPKLLVYMKTKRSRHLQPLKAAAIGVVCTM